MNLPNKLSLSRIILIPFIVLFYLLGGVWGWFKLFAILLFIAACVTDSLDGKIARKYNLITTLGKFLDSIADKMLILTVLCLIVVDGTIINPIGVICFVIVMCRELLISALRQIGAAKNIVIAADYWGKVKATAQMASISLFLLFSFLKSVCVLPSFLNVIFIVLCYASLFVMMATTIFSCVNYLLKNKQLWKE